MWETIRLMKMFKNGPFYAKNIRENNENLQIKMIFRHNKNMLGGSSKNHVFFNTLELAFIFFMSDV